MIWKTNRRIPRWTEFSLRSNIVVLLLVLFLNWPKGGRTMWSPFVSISHLSLCNSSILFMGGERWEIGDRWSGPRQRTPQTTRKLWKCPSTAGTYTKVWGRVVGGFVVRPVLLCQQRFVFHILPMELLTVKAGWQLHRLQECFYVTGTWRIIKIYHQVPVSILCAIPSIGGFFIDFHR